MLTEYPGPVVLSDPEFDPTAPSGPAMLPPEAPPPPPPSSPSASPSFCEAPSIAFLAILSSPSALDTAGMDGSDKPPVASARLDPKADGDGRPEAAPNTFGAAPIFPLLTASI